MDHPTETDLPYLIANFVPLDVLARAHGHDPAEVRRVTAAVGVALSNGDDLTGRGRGPGALVSLEHGS